MINELLLNILKQKIESSEVNVAEIKNAEYKTAIEEWLKLGNKPLLNI
nr:hypothetical protein [uncultured Aminipila sp.]